MIEDFAQLIKQAAAGDEASVHRLLEHFRAQAISVEEQEQLQLYLKHAARQDHHAIYLQGILYEHGYGVAQDNDMAFLLMREAAGKGNAKATYEVGRHYLQGIGVSQHYESAFQWLSRAAGSPHYVPEAMYDLARLYENGWGVAPDANEARVWYEKAASKGHEAAKKALAAIKSK
ncbi:tetratricopeptide repeat protein [Aquicella lusitana]|uniref:Sel1 repeat-containing protein n=1 Tax=Aquicella lusitana TaxID=254246 RepID=A0A370GT83_9COXI|nr:tetratricopeptide repeat protein [Aquicella lusitana]RDI46885.1 hypothetical protein C8D86_1047 [Aquicella lusitana]VVC73776.1 Localization factor PodJL [Aquicella lusitana]